MLQACFSFPVLGPGGVAYKEWHGFRYLVLSRTRSTSQQAQMDSFTNIIFPTEVPTDKDGGGSGGNAYCVVAHTTTVDAPTNMDNGGSGGNAYCVIA
jgi:hypothetical protein